MISFNRLEFTKQAIEAMKWTVDYPYVLTVVDNNSLDDTKVYLQELKQNGTIKNLILLDENIGVAKASNLAWRMEPEAGYYLKLDNDIVMQKHGWLSDMIKVIEAFQNIGALAYNFEPVSYPSQTIDRITVRVKQQGTLGGACILIPKRTEDKLGYWCEDYGLYGEEDSDYGHRILMAGLLNVYMADENAGSHLPAGKAAVIENDTWKATDGIEEKSHAVYRQWKDKQRKLNIENGILVQNLSRYGSDPSSLYQTSAFVEKWRENHPTLPKKEHLLKNRTDLENPLNMAKQIRLLEIPESGNSKIKIGSKIKAEFKRFGRRIKKKWKWLFSSSS
jgi:hypothetical protein